MNTDDYDALQASIQDLSHPNCRMLLAERDDALRTLALCRKALRAIAISSVTASPDVLHHFQCAVCGGRWSGRRGTPEQHSADCLAAL